MNQSTTQNEFEVKKDKTEDAFKFLKKMKDVKKKCKITLHCDGQKVTNVEILYML